MNISGTEIIAAAKLEVEDVESEEGVDGGRISCSVLWFVIPTFITPVYYNEDGLF